LIPGLFNLRTRQPIAVYHGPTSKYLQLTDTSLGQIFLYTFGAETHGRLLVCGPGRQLRESGVDPAHDAFWAAYVREIGSTALIDPDRPSGYTEPKWPMPWIEWSSGVYAPPISTCPLKEKEENSVS
jgi:hypothetical protein